MKKVTGILIVLLLVAVGCNEDKMSVWGLTGHDTVARVLYDVDGIGLGATCKWPSSDEMKWGPEPSVVGACAIVEASWEASATDVDPKAPIPVTWLENLHAVPYAGVEIVDYIDDDRISNIRPNWIAGSKFMLKPDSRAALVVEYIDGDQTRDVMVGGMFTF